MNLWFDLFLTVGAFVAGVIAAVSGFGIGSVLTPILALAVDARLAVAAVSVPHVIGTALRFWFLRTNVDRYVLWSFGLTSAAGGLVGALFQGSVTSRWLMAVFGALLLFTAGSELTGLARRMRFRGSAGWIAGASSGFLGGLVGNQGGIRSAALLGFDLSKDTFVATATAIALFVDGARLPVYLATQHREIAGIGRWVAVAAIGVVAGTLLGKRVLEWIPESRFRRVVAVTLAVLGAAMLARAGSI